MLKTNYFSHYKKIIGFGEKKIKKKNNLIKRGTFKNQSFFHLENKKFQLVLKKNKKNSATIKNKNVKNITEHTKLINLLKKKIQVNNGNTEKTLDVPENKFFKNFYVVNKQFVPKKFVYIRSLFENFYINDDASKSKVKLKKEFRINYKKMKPLRDKEKIKIMLNDTFLETRITSYGTQKFKSLAATNINTLLFGAGDIEESIDESYLKPKTAYLKCLNAKSLKKKIRKIKKISKNNPK